MALVSVIQRMESALERARVELAAFSEYSLAPPRPDDVLPRLSTLYMHLNLSEADEEQGQERRELLEMLDEHRPQIASVVCSRGVSTPSWVVSWTFFLLHFVIRN